MLRDKSTLANPFYTFEFIKDWSPESPSIFFATTDDSTAVSRYNQFTLIENASGSTTGGTSVALNLDYGQYTYRVWESTASTLSTSASTIVINKDRMVVGNFVADLNIVPGVYD